MKLSEMIKALEDDRDNWEALTGDILATLHVNLERGHLTAAYADKFCRWLSEWHMRRTRLQASGADLANVTFRQKANNVEAAKEN